MEAKIQAFIDSVKVRNGNEPEFIQAVTEVAETVLPFIENNPKFHHKTLNDSQFKKALKELK